MAGGKSGVASEVGIEIEPSDAYETLVAIGARTRLTARVAGQAPDVCRDEGFGRAARFASVVGLHKQAAFALETLKLGRAPTTLAALMTREALIQRLLVVEACAAVRYAEAVGSEALVGRTDGAAVYAALRTSQAAEVTAEALIRSVVIILSQKTVELTVSVAFQSVVVSALQAIGDRRPETGFAEAVAVEAVVSAQILSRETNDGTTGPAAQCEALGARETGEWAGGVAGEARGVTGRAAALRVEELGLRAVA